MIIQGVRYQLTIYSKNVSTHHSKPDFPAKSPGELMKVFQPEFLHLLPSESGPFPFWECKGNRTSMPLQHPVTYFLNQSLLSKGLQS